MPAVYFYAYKLQTNFTNNKYLIVVKGVHCLHYIVFIRLLPTIAIHIIKFDGLEKK